MRSVVHLLSQLLRFDYLVHIYIFEASILYFSIQMERQTVRFVDVEMFWMRTTNGNGIMSRTVSPNYGRIPIPVDL